MSVSRYIVVALTFAAVLASGAAAAGPVEDALELAATDPAAAIEALEGIRGDEAQRAQLEAAHLHVRGGAYAQAERIYERQMRTSRATNEARAAYGEYLIFRGRYDDAIEVLDEAVEGREGPHPAARYWRARAFHLKGRRSRARADLEDFIRDYNAGRATTAEQLTWVGRACHAMGLHQDANQAFRDAVAADDSAIDARLAWAELFLEKYRADEAKAVMDEAVARAPHDPRVLTLSALAELSTGYDVVAAREQLASALEQWPGYPQALEALAGVEIDTGNWDAAAVLLQRSLEANPLRLESLSLLAAVYYLKDDAARFSELEEQVMALDPLYARFYWVVGEQATRVFRYREALALNQQALQLDAGFGPAFLALGFGHSRRGDDERALHFLRRAFEADPFNVFAYNMANLYEGALSRYEFVDDEQVEGLRYRFHQSESAVLRRYIPEAVRHAWELYRGRYGITPELPVSVEVFREPETFGIRSVGLPQVHLHGICFGHVVTSRSPSEGNFNWRIVIEHEMSHVFSLERSNYRVPRWLTEGMAEYDTLISRPEWRREHELTIVNALHAGELIGLADLNWAFTGAGSSERLVAAYFQASLVVEFIGIRWGYDSLLAMLDGYGRSLQTPAVVQEVLGVDLEEFDRLFEEHIRRRYAHLMQLFEPDPTRYSDLEAARSRARREPSSADALAELAVAELVNGNDDSSADALAQALAIESTNPLANYFAATVAESSGDNDTARRYFESLLDGGVESYSARMSLARIARAEGQEEAALVHLRRAAELYPRSAAPHLELAEILSRRGLAVEATEHLHAYVMREENDFAVALRAAGELRDRGDLDRAWQMAEIAGHVDPFQRDLHTVLGQLAHQRAQWEVARRELELELAAGPVDRQNTLQMLVDTYTALGLSDEAEAARRQLNR